MKKLFLSLIAVIVGTMGSYAQSDLVATLTHGSSLTTFTGATALSEAYTAAAEGDVITLSPGVFNAVDIEKAITVRGAGMVGLESNGYVSTQLSGNLTINVPLGTSSVLTIEGVHVLGVVEMRGDNLAPVKISKSRFENPVDAKGVNMSAYASIFTSYLCAKYGDGINTTLNCHNCVIEQASSYGRSSGAVSKIVATNCTLHASSGSHYLYGGNVDGSIFTNCIIICDAENSYSILPNTCSAQNCIGISQVNSLDIFANIVNSSNVMIEGTGEAAFTPIFKTLKSLSSNPAITETFELTETAAATYLGNDGTQVGIYGGSYPFDPTPTNPQVKKFTVSNTTDGGTLKVKINVQ